MGAIQSGINQLFATAGIMARLSPELSAKAETRTKLANLKKQEETMAEARDIATNFTEKEQYQEDIHDIKKQIFETDPTAESYKEYRESALTGKSIEIPADPDEIAQEIAEQELYEEDIRRRVEALKKPYSPDQVMNNMAEKGKAKVEQRAKRRNFMKALGSEPVNFGSGVEGTVSDLPKNLQKAIAAQYSKSQRKELMDKKYGEK